MSHVRNLLHKRSPHLMEYSPPVSIASAGEDPGVAHVRPEFAADPVLPEPAAAPTCPRFPVLEASIDPSIRVVFHSDPRSPASDRFRFLRMRLRERAKTGKLKRLLVTSPLPCDGKTTMILNLATALSERAKHSVLVVEADLHHPTIAKRLGVSGSPGFAECLQDGLDPLSAIRSVEPVGWHLLPSGEVRRNPSEMLQTPAMADIMQRLASHFDWILLDSPPASPLTDTLLLQQHTDGTLMVVRAGATTREAVEQTVGLLGPKNIIATILNGVEASDHFYYKYRQNEPPRE